MDAVSGKNRTWVIALAIISACLSVLLYSQFARITTVEIDGITHWHTNDDAMITMRVAETFARTGMPYINEGEPVAANTSLFWPIFVAPVFWIFDNANAIPVLIGLSLVTAFSAAWIATSIIKQPLARVSTFFALIIGPAFLRYAPSIWEHVPQMLLCTLAFVSMYRASENASRLFIPTNSLYLLALAFLIRPDTAPIIAVVVTVWFLTDQRYRKRETYMTLAALMLAPIAYVVGMQTFYGDFVPNTAHLKMLDTETSLQLAINYISSPIRSGPVPLMLIGLVLLRNLTPAGWVIVYAAILHLIYVIWVGGDYFATGRFFLHFLPMISAMLVVGVLNRFPQLTRNTALLIVPISLSLVVTTATLLNERLRDIARLGAEPLHVEQIRAVRSAVATLSPSDGAIGLHFLGIGYHAPNFHLVDFLGKADPVIARSEPRNSIIGHNKWNYDYSLSTFDVAAVPVPQVFIEFLDASDSPNFWVHANAALRARDYHWVSPDDLKNQDNGFGLYVSPDLSARFVD